MSLNQIGAAQAYHISRAFQKVRATVRQLVNIREVVNLLLRAGYHAPEIEGAVHPSFENIGSQNRHWIPAIMNRISSKIAELRRRSVGTPAHVVQQVTQRVKYFNYKLDAIEQEYQLLAQHGSAFVEAGYGFISHHDEDLHIARNRLSTSLLGLEDKLDVDVETVKFWEARVAGQPLLQPPDYSEGITPPDYCEHPRDADHPPPYLAF
ncbi:uncharacterized protein PAC_13011 [Phialocephala subalpina]|uniref:Uncharacterized protein n=1 Tax=Phialocephala subalpina TaxID=576137 RepID=A0A1L7XDL1_9HELO|nr:uncharacterized protein PAC_13011 [Phialocephala subalpina]